MNTHIELSKLQLKEQGIVVSIDATSISHRQQLLAHGVVPGAVVQVIRLAPLGGPIQLQINHGIMLIIRRQESKAIKVEKVV